MLQISAWTTAIVLLLLAGMIVAAGVTLQLLQIDCPGESLCSRSMAILDPNGEGNLPAWFSSLLWFGAAALALFIAVDSRPETRRWRRHWLGLVALFVFLSFDEAAKFHEAFGSALGDYVMARGTFFYTWIIYGLLLLAAVALIYVRFWWALPSDSRWLLILSAAVFTTGAVGIETIGGAADAGLFRLGGSTWALLIGLEEALEMVGVILLIYMLLRYRSGSAEDVRLRITD
jgi:hypothetical protein